MMIKKTVLLFILIFVLMTTATNAVAATYYIDWVSGADTNNGTSKATPWKRAPGMHGCSDNCAAYQTAHGDPSGTSGAGDNFFLKGGVTWPQAALSWDWYFGSGTEANPIYFGIDQTWYDGSSWSRPVIDVQGQVPHSSLYVNAVMRVYGTWFVVDNLEFTGYAQLDDLEDSTHFPRILLFGTSTAADGEIKNCYFHGWSHGGTATKDLSIAISVQQSGLSVFTNLKIHHNVFDGSDTSKDMMMILKGSVGHFYNNYIRYVTNGFVGNNALYFWGNTFEDVAPNLSFDPTSHMNGIENMTAQSIIYNNFFKNTHGGVTIWIQQKNNLIDYVFNNVVINDYNQGIQADSRDLASGNTAGAYIFNNTMQADDSGGGRIAGSSSSPNLSFLTVMNNHLIGGGTPRIVPKNTTAFTASNNVEMTNAAVASAGFVATGPYPFCPSSGSSTVVAGINLSTLAASIPSSAPSDAATAALSDTTLGVAYDSMNHRVIGPNKPPIVRGTTWYVGAYQFSLPSHLPSPPQMY